MDAECTKSFLVEWEPVWKNQHFGEVEKTHTDISVLVIVS